MNSPAFAKLLEMLWDNYEHFYIRPVVGLSVLVRVRECNIGWFVMPGEVRPVLRTGDDK